MKKFFSLVLALVMALSLTTVAWGAEADITAELQAKIDDPAVSVIELATGDYGVIDVTVNRKLTIKAAEGATVKIAGIDGQSNNNATDITIQGITIDNALQTEGWFIGTSPNINPCVGAWGGNYTFEDCTFHVTGASKAETGVMTWWTTNAGTMNFKNCTFNGDNGSARAMQIYGNYDLNVEGCTFNTAKDYSIKYVGAEGRTATFKNNIVNNTQNFVQTGSATYAGEDYTLVFEGNTLAGDIEHVYIDNDENQHITIATSTTTKFEAVATDGEAASTVIDVSDSATTTTVEMSAAAADEVFTNAKPVEIVTADASITFSKEAAGTIGTNAGSSAVTLTVDVEEAPAVADVEPANTAAYNEVMANADADNAVLLSIELTDANGDALFSETNAAGTATVKVALPAGLNTAKLYYLDGANAEYLGEYTADANGYIYVELEHFSQYVIVGGTRTVVSGNTGNANGSYSSSTVNGTTTTVSGADKYVIYPAGATNVLTNVNTNAFVVKSYTSLSTWTVVSNGVTTQSYIPAYYTLTDGTKLYEADENCGEYRLFKDGVFVTYLNDLNGAIGSGNYVDGDFIADAATYVAKSKGCDTYNVDVYMLNGKVPTMVNKDGWNVAVINGKVAVYSNLPAGSYTAHTFTDEVTYKSTTDLTVVAIECDKCEKSFQVVKTSKLPATYKGATAPLFFGGNNYYILLESAAVSGNTGVVGGTTTGKVESAATFDAGIAMYVGMSVMAAAGSAVVLKKRED